MSATRAALGGETTPLPSQAAHGATFTPQSALQSLTDIQTAALIATAERHRRPREELAAEWLPLLYIEPSGPSVPFTEIIRSAVKPPLTPDTRPIVAQPQEAHS